MKDDIISLQNQFKKDLSNATDRVSLEDLHQRFFGRQTGVFTERMKRLQYLSTEEKKQFGIVMNQTKQEMQAAYEEKRLALQKKEWQTQLEQESIDLTRPEIPQRQKGHLHPMTQAISELEAIARGMGFMIEDGPEIESEYYVFDALNIPSHHPARDAQDTFYLKGLPGLTMRSHVSGMQVRQMRKYGAPLRAVHLGRVYRNEALDVTHGHTFYQFDCIVVDKGLSLSHMVGVIQAFLEGLYKREVALRLRPSYFPFVEPAIEMEMKVTTGVGEQQKTKWTEIVGSGSIHPTVIRAGGLDPKKYDGFAFSFGVDRLVMGKYQIEDIRHIHGGDLRFLEQF